MSARSAFRRVLGRAVIGPLNLGVAGAAAVGAVALASWPIALLGGAAYATLVATDVVNPVFRKRVLSGRGAPATLPAATEITDPGLRKAVESVTAARAEIERIAAAIPERIRRNVTGALAAADELVGHAAALVARGDALARYLADADHAEARAEVERLGGLATTTKDAAARAQYEQAAVAATGRVRTLDEIAVARERIVANLTRVVAALRGVPPSLMQLQALDDQASDALTGAVGGDLDRMNIELRAFEDTLATLVEGADVKQKWVIIGVFIAFAVLLVAMVGGKKKPGGKAGPGPTATLDGGAARGGDKQQVELVYSSEKKDWIEAAVAGFEQANPDVDVILTSKGSLDAANAILDGGSKPVLWSPADSLIINLLASDWQTKFGKRPFAADGDAGPQQLLLSPLVFAVWEERAKVLLASAGSDTLTWKAIRSAVVSPKGWAAIGGKPGWGFVKLGHTDPNKSNSGLQALLLMTLEYYDQTSGLTVDQLLDEKYQAWIKDIERGVPSFEASTGTFMTDMIRFGPSKYDIAVVYESLAISQLENAQGRWGNLHIYYPPVTLWSDHPVVVLDAPWVTAAQQAAGRRVVEYLRGREAQSLALRFGFRPADTSLPVKSSDAANPFVRLGQYGLALELPQAATPPDGAVIRNLLMMWSRVARPQ